MTKNMTRKGLAFGAGLALVATGLTAAPATAAVDDNAVSLVPRSGTQYSMVTDGFFDLKSTQSTSAASSTGTISYKVTDAGSISKFDYQSDTTVTTTDVSQIRGATIVPRTAAENELTLAYDISEGLMTLTNPDDDDLFAGYAVGDQIQVVGLASATSDAQVTATFTSYVISNTALDALTFLAPVLAGNDDDTSDLSAEDVTGISLTEVPVISWNGARGALNVVDNYMIQFDVSENQGKILNNNAANDAFENTAVGDVFKLTGINSASINAFSDFVVVTAITDELMTFTVSSTTKMAAIAAADVGSEDLSAGTFEPVTDSLQLEEYGSVLAGALGGIVTSLAAPVRAANGSYVIVGPDADSTKTDLLRLVASAAGTVTVQAWIDDNADGLIDSTEATSSARTVTFVSWANSGAALNIETPVAGAEWEVYVSFNSTINASQIPATRLDVALGVLDSGTLEKAVAATTASNGAFTAATSSLVFDDAVNHVDNFWGLKIAPATTLPLGADGVDNDNSTVFVAGYTYAGQIFLDGAAYGNIAYTNTGAAVADTLGAVAATRGDNVRQSSTTVTVKEDYTGSVEFKVLLTVADATVAGNPTGAGAGKVAVAAGTEATVKIAKGSLLDADSTISSGGKTLTNVSDPAFITYTVLSDANGYVTFTLTNDEAEVGDDLNITVTHAGTAVTADVTWAAPTAADSVLSGATVVSTLAKATWSNTYTAVDDFGAPLAGPTYRLSVTYYDAIGGTQKTTGVALNASGQGTLTVTDKSLAVGNFSVVATLQKLGTDAVYANFGSPEQVTSTVFVVGNMTPSAVTIVETITTADAGDPLTEPVPAVAANATAPNGDVAPSVSTAEKTVISGVVTSSSGSAVRGASVVVSAPGLFFKSGNVYTVGSATVVTNNAGAYTVEVRSNFAGEQLVTVTAGAVTKTKSIGFDAVAATVGTSLVVDAPASIAAGSSFTVKVSLMDAFGNPVAADATRFGLTYSGAGIALSVPTVTNALGQASFAVLLGSNDTGAGTITATYDADATKSTVDNNYSVVKTVNGAASSDTKVNAGSFLGYVAVYAKGHNGSTISWKIAGKWFKTTITSDYQVFQRKTVAVGMDVNVDIYIDSVKVLSKVVATR